ncbi:MAG: amidohydrolase family protein [Candidatus Binatia bacterium]|nr:amidohydrolase family protein [Candidatus Binatia bacterium]
MDRIVFTNANLFDGHSAPRAGATVVVEDGRIAALDPPSVPTDGQQIDLGGRTLMPGMVQGHFHSTYRDIGAQKWVFGFEKAPIYHGYIAAENARCALLWGFTSVVGASAAWDVDPSLRDAIEDGLLEGPRVVPSSHDLVTTGDTTDNRPGYMHVSNTAAARVCDGPDEFRHAVRDEIKQGVEMLKVFASGGHYVSRPQDHVAMTAAELDAVVEAAHGRGARVRAHAAGKRAILQCLDAGVDIIDHADGLDDECIERIVKTETFILPSLYLPLCMMQLMGDPAEEGKTEYRTAGGQEFAYMCSVLAKADAAGVRIATGDDFGSVGVPHGDYAKELEVYVRYAGIPAQTVLRWATKNGGAMTGWDDVGTIEVGKLADLVVVDGDPTTDITILQDQGRLHAILKGGRFVKPLPG